MSKKKGMSLEEKRQHALDFFYETADVFQLKTLEKRLAKEKGIAAMSIKDVIQSLIDDNLIHCEKIGTSNYYWSFPSEGLHIRKRKIEELDEKISEATKKKERLMKSVKDEKNGREETEERAQVLEELEKEKKLTEEYLTELQQFKDCDPEVIAEKEKSGKLAKEAANRWTDNIFSVKSWVQKKFNMDSSTFHKSFQIPEDFDYIE